jgi:hypothetical protein
LVHLSLFLLAPLIIRELWPSPQFSTFAYRMIEPGKNPEKADKRKRVGAERDSERAVDRRIRVRNAIVIRHEDSSFIPPAHCC